MRATGSTRSAAGRTLVVVVACVAGVVLSLLGATAVLAVTGVALGSGSSGSAPREARAVVTPSPTRAAGTSVVAAPTSAPTPAPTASAVVPAPVATRAPAATPKVAPAPAPTRRVAGALVPVVGVTDGDTIKVRVGASTERVRVIGLDAPELKGDECWAQKASSKMQSLVQSRSVRLVADPTQDDRDRYGRLLRHVVTEDGRLAAQVLIEGGFAKEYTYRNAYEHRGDYLAAQKRAQARKVGVWSAACSAPVVAPAVPGTTTKPSSCVIKGNISSSGEKIFHVPGGGSYDDTVITASKGERWFCTEDEARAAGWRKARN
ncbi:thermonuclease family protein [Knoellia sp. CPCC 206450]|uniref:thermonuclease family protein n=1 Tax=Knoellia tibetensis TaxID=3404798 RepID=UPI003B4395FE